MIEINPTSIQYIAPRPIRLRVGQHMHKEIEKALFVFDKKYNGDRSYSRRLSYRYKIIIGSGPETYSEYLVKIALRHPTSDDPEPRFNV